MDELSFSNSLDIIPTAKDELKRMKILFLNAMYNHSKPFSWGYVKLIRISWTGTTSGWILSTKYLANHYIFVLVRRIHYQPSQMACHTHHICKSFRELLRVIETSPYIPLLQFQLQI